MRIIFFVIVLASWFSCRETNIKSLTATGIRQYENDSLEESIRSLSKVIDITDTCTDCFLYRGFAYKELEQFDKAMQDFNSLIKIDSTSVGYANRASVHYMKKDYHLALQDFSKAYELDSSKIFLNPICHMLFANGYKDSACVLYHRLLAEGDTTFNNSIRSYCDNKNK